MNEQVQSELKKIQKEANALHSKAYYCSQNHTVLLNQKSNKFDINDTLLLNISCV